MVESLSGGRLCSLRKTALLSADSFANIEPSVVNSESYVCIQLRFSLAKTLKFLLNLFSEVFSVSKTEIWLLVYA